MPTKYLSPGRALRELAGGFPSLGQVYARLYPIRKRTVRQLAEQFRVSQTLIRSRLTQLINWDLVEADAGHTPEGRPVTFYTRKIRSNHGKARP